MWHLIDYTLEPRMRRLSVSGPTRRHSTRLCAVAPGASQSRTVAFNAYYRRVQHLALDLPMRFGFI